MSILGVLIILTAIGFLLYAVNRWIPMPNWMKTTINVVAAIMVFLWLLGLLAPGLFSSLTAPRFHRGGL